MSYELISPPPSLRGEGAEDLRTLRSWLFRLSEQLNLAAARLDGERETIERTAGQAERTSALSAERAANLKALILQNARDVEREMETLDASLRSRYVAQSDFGEYREAVEARFEATPEYVRQEIGFDAAVTAAGEAVDALRRYQSEMQGYLKAGIVDWDGLNPVLGIAVGQDLAYTETTVTVDGTEYTEIDKRRFSSVFTASELAFYQGNQKVAYLANDKLYVTDATFTGSVSLGDAWEISHARGFTVKWIGG